MQCLFLLLFFAAQCFFLYLIGNVCIPSIPAAVSAKSYCVPPLTAPVNMVH